MVKTLSTHGAISTDDDDDDDDNDNDDDDNDVIFFILLLLLLPLHMLFILVNNVLRFLWILG